MALNITYTIECHCGEDAKTTVTHIDLNPGEPIVIDAELTLGQQDFECDDCGCVTGTGDLYTEIGRKGTGCDGEDDD
jgi:hypothetical protein